MARYRDDLGWVYKNLGYSLVFWDDAPSSYTILSRS